MISVIMLAYNRANYIRYAIESVLKQTYRDFELLIIDNNASDGTSEVLREYEKKDERIRLFKRTDSKIGAGRNLGLENISGEYFTFVDDDDYCEADYLSFLHNLAETYNADITVCGSYYDTKGEITPKYVFDETILCKREQAITNFLLRRYFNNGNPTKLFRRTPAISAIRYPENGQYDDIHTMYKFFSATGEQPIAVAAKGEPKYIVRRHMANNSSATLDFSKLTPEWLSEYLTAYRKRTEYISVKFSSLAELVVWSEWSYMISMVEKINRFSLANCSSQLVDMTAELKYNRERFLSAEWTRDFEKEWIKEYIL
ncbi:hypothetical protein FACS1894111_03550 [Clostridia bacterium]|nr:hypothetical protein FACS1894111_03550 [Clostridia bacterium]